MSTLTKTVIGTSLLSIALAFGTANFALAQTPAPNGTKAAVTTAAPTNVHKTKHKHHRHATKTSAAKANDATGKVSATSNATSVQSPAPMAPAGK